MSLSCTSTKVRGKIGCLLVGMCIHGKMSEFSVRHVLGLRILPVVQGFILDNKITVSKYFESNIYDVPQGPLCGAIGQRLLSQSRSSVQYHN